LADEWRRYLAQQAELGGAEVILGAPLTRESHTAPMPIKPPSTTAARASGESRSGDVSPEGSVSSSAPSAGASSGASAGPAHAEAAPTGDRADSMDTTAEPNTAEPKWMRGAPPIPGPGIVVLSPAPVLLGNDLGMLDSLDAVAERIRTTYCCELCPNRTNAVPGEGNPKARMVLVGEGPGATEDATGRPFVGQAGQLLDSILEAIDVPRSSVYITNIVKCRPPQNRKPLPDEIAACIPYLHRQLDLIAPKVIVAMGGTAGEALLGVRKSLGELRGKVHTYNGIPLVVTYHPAALLRNPNWKKPTWDDVRIARQLLDR
jgi:DNA polymerase